MTPSDGLKHSGLDYKADLQVMGNRFQVLEFVDAFLGYGRSLIESAKGPCI